MREAIKTIKYKGYNINVYQDEFSESPREWDNLGIMLCSHHRYTLGDKQLGKEGFYQYIQEKYNIVDFGDKQTFLVDCDGELTEKGYKKIQKWIEKNIVGLRLYLYDHSGISISIDSFVGKAIHAEWDSGQVGIIYVDYATIKKEYGVKKVTKKLIKKVTDILNSEVKIYNDYISGSVYVYMIESEESDETGGCWGFYGYDWKENGLLDHAKEEIDCIIKENEDIKNNIASMVI